MKYYVLFKSHRTPLVEEYLEQRLIMAFTNVQLGEEIFHPWRLIAGRQKFSFQFVQYTLTRVVKGYLMGCQTHTITLHDYGPLLAELLKGHQADTFAESTDFGAQLFDRDIRFQGILPVVGFEVTPQFSCQGIQSVSVEIPSHVGIHRSCRPARCSVVATCRKRASDNSVRGRNSDKRSPDEWPA